MAHIEAVQLSPGLWRLQLPKEVVLSRSNEPLHFDPELWDLPVVAGSEKPESDLTSCGESVLKAVFGLNETFRLVKIARHYVDLCLTRPCLRGEKPEIISKASFQVLAAII